MTILLVANDGGHLMQLHRLAPRLGLDAERVWITVPTPQSRSLLDGETVHWVGRAPTRDVPATVRNARLARPVFGEYCITSAVSTGSSLAVSVLPQARARHIDTYYVESATRVKGPSMSGRMLSLVPGIRLYTQYPTWAGGRWRYGGSVFDGFKAHPRAVPDRIHRVVVSLGTSEKYSFRRLVERLAQLLPREAEVLWQTGSTSVDGLDVEARVSVPALELHTAMRNADLVVAHAGTGVALAALAAGKLPLLVPRRPEHREHVDDHQVQIVTELANRGLAVYRELEELAEKDLVDATAWTIEENDPVDFDW